MRTSQPKSQTSPKTQPASQQSGREEAPPTTKRLHITPLTEALLPRLLGSHISLAQDISFHCLTTFPNRNYGFVTLPIGAAEMVRKRVQGTLLKGERVAVEDARPDTRLEKAELERTEEQDTNVPQRSLRKRKREEGVIAATATAVELPSDRKVKRGWTETKADKEGRKIREKREKKKKDGKTNVKTSAFTDQSECLFQTAVPGKDKKGKKSKGTTVVHEFEKTTKFPGYLKQAATDKKKTKEFDEEKGWVDENGDVVEAPAENTRPSRTRRGARKVNDIPATEKQNEDDDDTSSSGTSSDSEAEEQQESEDAPEEKKASPPPAATTEDKPKLFKGPLLSVTEPSPVSPHPLETLFKKPKPPTSDPSSKSNLAINTSFTFFDKDNAEDGTGAPQIEKSLETPGLPALRRRGLPNLSIPVTPYNHHDTQWRSQRSAAPTPDTAAPGKGAFGDPFGLLADIRREREQDIEEEDEEELENDDDDVMQGVEQEDRAVTPPIKAEPPADGKEGDFQKWFWENRGANTRAWKKRKHDASKEQRARENRKRKG